MEQKHLNHKDTVNLGSFYTPEWVVALVYKLIQRNVPNNQANPLADYYILDTSCGYGGFLRGNKAIGADIDNSAVQTAKKNNSGHTYFNHNSLFEISRSQYKLGKDAKIIIVGNPPYNDTTSIIRNDIKGVNFLRDSEVMSRDLGISFLLSYDKLQADYVCVLHPLSYLIKKANFEALMSFKNNYRLMDSVIISSGVFSDTSKTTSFPIIIAFYERNLCGMDYAYIKQYKFKTIDNKSFTISQWDTIGNYISKYPNHKTVNKKETVAYFYTLRDINALKRTATFLKKETSNAIRVTKTKLPYYCYADVFKDYLPHVPYYFGNSDVMINNSDFLDIQDLFEQKSIQKHPWLAQQASLSTVIERKNYNDMDIELNKYFRNLLGEHYVD